METILSENWVNHYVIDKEDCNDVYVEWIDKSSQHVMDELRESISGRWTESCSCVPYGNVMVWSKEDKAYLNCGPTEKYF